MSRKTLLKKIKDYFKTFDETLRGKASETVEYELYELENIFALITLGSFVGIPSPPMQITLELLPLMDEEIVVMMDKIATANSPLSDLVSIMDVY